MNDRLCLADLTDRNDEHRQYRCRLSRGHPDVHRDGTCEWTDATTWFAEDREPARPLTEREVWDIEERSERDKALCQRPDHLTCMHNLIERAMLTIRRCWDGANE